MAVLRSFKKRSVWLSRDSGPGLRGQVLCSGESKSPLVRGPNPERPHRFIRERLGLELGQGGTGPLQSSGMASNGPSLVSRLLKR